MVRPTAAAVCARRNPDGRRVRSRPVPRIGFAAHFRSLEDLERNHRVVLGLHDQRGHRIAARKWPGGLRVVVVGAIAEAEPARGEAVVELAEAIDRVQLRRSAGDRGGIACSARHAPLELLQEAPFVDTGYRVFPGGVTQAARSMGAEMAHTPASRVAPVLPELAGELQHEVAAERDARSRTAARALRP